MRITSLIENKDGSANMNVDMSEAEMKIFLEIGIITAIKEGIKISDATPASPDNIKMGKVVKPDEDFEAF